MKAKDTFDSVLGSTGLTAAADGIYVLERKADGKPFGRLSFISRDLPDGDLPVRFDHDTCRWYPIASSDMERELLLADEAMSALVSFMKQELIYEGTATDLCERLGLNIGANNLSSKLSKYKNSLQKIGIDCTKEKRNNHKVFTLNYNRKEPEYDGTMKSAYTPEALKKLGEEPFVGISENGLHRLFCPFRSKQYCTLPCYSLFPPYPNRDSRLAPFSVVFALLLPPSFPRLLLFGPSRKVFFGTMTSADFLRFSRTSPHGFDGCQSFCPSPPRKTSPVKSSNLPLIYLPHLHHRVRAVLDFVLFSRLVRPVYALYAISVRQTESLP